LKPSYCVYYNGRLIEKHHFFAGMLPSTSHIFDKNIGGKCLIRPISCHYIWKIIDDDGIIIQTMGGTHLTFFAASNHGFYRSTDSHN